MKRSLKIECMVRNWTVHNEFDRWLLYQMVKNGLIAQDLERAGISHAMLNRIRKENVVKENEIKTLAALFGMREEKVKEELEERR